jgi:hypothetical protein
LAGAAARLCYRLGELVASEHIGQFIEQRRARKEFDLALGGQRDQPPRCALPEDAETAMFVSMTRRSTPAAFTL